MDWKSIKTSREVVLDGIAAHIEREDRSIRSVTFTDAAGHAVLVKSDYGLRVCVPQEPEKAQVSKVTGEIAGVKIDESYEDGFTARQRATELKDAGATVELQTADEDIPF